jgi:hypothetical protein
MPSYIVKPDREVDWYVMWSDIVEAPTGGGTRAQVKACRYFKADEVADKRFDQADRTGCSALWPEPDRPIYGWDSSGFIYMQRGWLPRTNLRAAVERLLVNENDPITDLLRPFEDATEVRAPAGR